MLVHATHTLSVVQAMADIFALGCIQSDVMFRNDDYIAAEKVGYLAHFITCMAPLLGGQVVFIRRRHAPAPSQGPNWCP